MGNEVFLEDLFRVIDLEVSEFVRVPLVSRAAMGDVRISDYHMVLVRLYHQVRSSSLTFDLAASRCSESLSTVRDYLERHAEEERGHWLWIKNDLESTGYSVLGLDDVLVYWATDAYIAYNYFVAERFPLGRLAIACYLESVGAAFGEAFGKVLLGVLKLKASQMSFFLGHGSSDVMHRREIFELLRGVDLTSENISKMINNVKCASRLYRSIFEEGA
jgi:hypothetical protein